MPLVLQLNLKRKAALFVAVILVAVVTGVSLTLVLTAVPIIRHSQLQSALPVGRQIVKDIRQVMDFGMALADLDQVPEMLEEAIRRNPGLGYLYVTDAAGKLHFRSGLVPPDLPAATIRLNHPAGADDAPRPTSASVSGESRSTTSPCRCAPPTAHSTPSCTSGRWPVSCTSSCGS